MATDEKCMKEANKDTANDEAFVNEDTETDDGRMEVFEAVPQKFELSRNLQEIEDFSITRRRNALEQYSVTREKR